MQPSPGRSVSASSAAMVDSSAATSLAGTLTVWPPRADSSQVGLASPPGASPVSMSSPKRITAPCSPPAPSNTCTWPRPISVIVPGDTSTCWPSMEWRPQPSRTHTSSW